MLNVLIVDDDHDLLEMVTLTLNKNNMHAVGISDDHQLTDSILKTKPDVILMDVCLGTADGRELCRQLKQTAAFKAIPVVLYSAINITDDSLRDSLADDFVGKPFDTVHLMDVIRGASAA